MIQEGPHTRPSSGRREVEREQLGRYRLEGRIGSGGMGTVYLAHDTILDRKVAVKVLAADLARIPQQRGRFLREAQAAARVSCPWVVAVHEVGDEDGSAFIVMEYVEGDSLASVLSAGGKLPIDQGVDILRQAAKALDVAHRKGILHRDIKPDNILLSRDGRVRITDFGIAKVMEASVLTRTGEMMGTAAYMAPEQALGESSDGRSDLYSLGCVAYEVFTGRLPFESETQVGLVYRHVNEEPLPPSRFRARMSPTLETVVLRLLAKAPGDRYQTAAEVVRALEDLIRTGGAERPADEVSPRQVGSLDAVDRQVRFVGRSQELDHLSSALQRAIAGRGSVQFIAGEAGVGKTRLAGELEQYAVRRGVRFLRGTCLYREETVPYLPFISAIRCYFRLARWDTRRDEREAVKEFLRTEAPELGAVVPQVGTFIGQRGQAASAPQLEDRDRERERLFEGISHLIRRISGYRPVVLFLDDLQWADRASLRLLHYVASSCEDHAMLLVGAYRAEELRGDAGPSEHSLLETLRRLDREGLAETVRLSQFGEGEVAALLVNLLGGGSVDPDLVRDIHLETSGNALFVLELVALMQQEGGLVNDGGVWRRTGPRDPIPIPNRVRGVLERRVDRLSDGDRSLLECAAVLGDPFDAGLVGRILSQRKIEILRRLQPLEKQLRMIRCGTEGFHFDHPKLQEVLYDGIPLELRRELHRLVAGEVERTSAPLEQKVFALARHYDEAADCRRAYPCLRAAADQAMRLHAHEERARLLGRALEIFDEAGAAAGERKGLLVDLGETAVILGDWDEAEQAFGRALTLSRRAEDQGLAARIVADMGFTSFKRSGWDEARGRYADALSRYEALGDFRGAAACQIGLGNVAFESGQWREAQERYRIARTVGTEHRLEDIVARANNNLGAVSNACGRHADATGCYGEALGCFLSTGNDAGAARAYHNLGMTYLDLKCWEKAESCFRESLAISTAIRQPELMSITYLLRSDLRFQRGRADQAREDCVRALALFKRRGDAPGEADAYRILGTILAAEGEWEEAERDLTRSLEINQACGQRLQSAETERELGHLHRRRGDMDAARQHLEKAAREFRQLGALGAAERTERDLTNLAADPGYGERLQAGTTNDENRARL